MFSKNKEKIRFQCTHFLKIICINKNTIIINMKLYVREKPYIYIATILSIMMMILLHVTTH